MSLRRRVGEVIFRIGQRLVERISGQDQRNCAWHAIPREPHANPADLVSPHLAVRDLDAVRPDHCRQMRTENLSVASHRERQREARMIQWNRLIAGAVAIDIRRLQQMLDELIDPLLQILEGPVDCRHQVLAGNRRYDDRDEHDEVPDTLNHRDQCLEEYLSYRHQVLQHRGDVRQERGEISDHAGREERAKAGLPRRRGILHPVLRVFLQSGCRHRRGEVRCLAAAKLLHEWAPGCTSRSSTSAASPAASLRLTRNR